MKYTLISSVLTVVSLLAGGCSNKWNILKDVQPSTGAQVRFMHAAPDAPAIDLFVNDQRVSGAAVTAANPTGSLLYGTVFPSFEYSGIPAGATKIKGVAASGGTVASPLLSADLNAEAGKRYTLFATGLAPAYSLVTITDEIPPVSGNSFFIRIVNLVPNATDATLIYDGKEITAGTAPEKASPFITVAFPADYKTGTIRTANIQSKINGVIPITLGAFTVTGIQPGAVLTYVVRGVLTTDAKTPTKFPILVTTYLSR